MSSPPVAQAHGDSHTERWVRDRCGRCQATCWKVGAVGAADTVTTCDSCVRNPNRVQQCAICLDTSLPFKFRHNTKADHSFCRQCLETYCIGKVDEGCLRIPCPCTGCDELLTDDELKSISAGLMLRVRRARTRDSQRQLIDFLTRETSLLAWLVNGKPQVQACPFCGSLVQRSRGCSHMTCTCGGEFCYYCGVPDGTPCLAIDHSSAEAKPELNLDLDAIVDERRARRLAFAMGTHPRSESIVAKLPGDLVRRVAMMAIPTIGSACVECDQ